MSAHNSDSNLSGLHFVEIDNRPFCEVENVRIYPKCVVFTNPFEGKQYAETIVIKNVGRDPVTIRILEATSSAIRFKANVRGKFVPPGLSIHTCIRYTFSMMTIVKTCSIPIYINMKKFDYPIEVELPCVFLKIEPHELNFGKVDAGPSTSTRSLKLINAGNKPSRFTIDLGTNYLGLLVEPMKGLIMEGHEKIITAELCLMHEGEYQSEFWILSEYPIPVKVYISGIHGQIKPANYSPLRDFTLLEFPCTYYGLKSYKVVLMKNKSQYNSLFHITGELERSNIHLDKIIEDEPKYKYFQVNPSNGRLPPRDVRSFTFIFSPTKKLLKLDGSIDSFLVIMNIHKLYCSDLDSTKYKDGTFYETSYVQQESTRSLGSIVTIPANAGFQFSSDFDDMGEETHHVLLTESYFKNTVRIMLYAVVEVPSVSALPDEITLTDQILKKTTTRVIQLLNNSKNLPIIYRYKKIAFVEVFPKTGILKPLEKHEVSIYVTPQSYEVVQCQLEFELLYHDIPNINKTLTVIGNVKIPLIIHQQVISKLKLPNGVPVANFKFNKPNIKPKRKMYEKLLKEEALLALPDDRPLSLRPWNSSKECRTIYAGIPRLKNVTDKYQLTELEQFIKDSNKDYYKNYIAAFRNTTKKSSSIMPDYEISSNINKCLMVITPRKETFLQANFTPLSSDQLYNIVVKPRNWTVDHVVAHSDFLNFVKITNNNNIAIRIFVRPHKPTNFKFPSGNRAILKAHEEISMAFTYFTNKVGIENHTLDFIINENHVFETSFSIKVDPKALKLGWDDTTFSKDGPLYTFLDVTNIFNTHINFNWEYTGDLIIEPLDATVCPGRTLTCMISYEIGKCSMNIYEIVMKVDNRKNQTLQVFIENFNFDHVTFIQNLNFGDIPLAMDTKITAKMYNGTRERLPFTTICDRLEKGISVDPLNGSIPPLGSQTFSIIANKNILGKFECELLIILADIKEFTVYINGNVRMPAVTISPDYFKFKKMSASSFDIKCIVIKNEDNEIPALIEFSTSFYPELYYSECIDSDFIKIGKQFILEPGMEKTFSIHLYPFHSTVTTYYLPIIINSINTGEAKQSKIANVKVHSTVLSHRLNIHTWRYEFVYFPHFNYKSHTLHTISISSHTSVQFCIRLDELELPFTFEHIEGGICTKHPCSLVCELIGNQKTIFLAKFKPNICGVYEIKLPVYVKDDLTESVHNYLYFKGTYPKPEVIYSDKEICFGILPLNMTGMKEITLELRYHNPDCDLMIFSEEVNIYSERSIKIVDSLNFVIAVQFYYYSNLTHTLSTIIEVSCSCGYVGKLPCSGGAENCFYSNYSFVGYFQITLDIDGDVLIPTNMMESRSSLISSTTISLQRLYETRNYNIVSSFPYFPSEVGSYLTFMERVLTSVEEWLYHQGFYGVIYHQIPDTISTYTVNTENVISSPLITLLTNVCGEKVMQTFNLEKKNKNNTLRIHRFYRHILQFLQSTGAIFPQIIAEYLLPYEDYCQFLKTSNRSDEILDKNQYYLLTKQCWLDLLLQLYKCLIYSRLTIDNNSSNAYLVKTSYDFDLYDNVYSHIATGLLNWLNKRLQNQKYNIVADKDSYEMQWISEKLISNFDLDLSDSLGLCGVTIFNCPYLIKHLKGMYVPPNDDEEYLHNAFSLVRIWQMLKIGYELKPLDIINSNSIQMLMFITYLYDFLINIRPKDELEISALLSEKNSEHFYITNDNEEDLKYNILLFDNDDEVFSVDSPIIVIKPHSKYKLIVSYHAKFLKKHKATIVLSGETKGRRSMYSKAFYVLGYPTLEKPIKEIIIKSPLYIAKPFSFNVAVPHIGSTEYELFYTDNVTNIDNLHLTPYYTFIKENIITAICLDSHVIKTNADGVGTVSGRVCSITTNKSMVHGFGRNPINGDFYITIIVNHARSNLDTEITIDMSKAYTDCTCICKSIQTPNIKCPRNILIKVPSRNQYMWKALMRHMLYNVDKVEWTFWESQQDTLLGVNIIKRILNDHKKFMGIDMQYVFKDKVQYSVKSNTKHVVFPKIFEIPNTEAASETTNMVVHLNRNLENLDFELESIDNLEIRVYRVIIKYKSN